MKKMYRRLEASIKISLMKKPVTIYYTPPKNIPLPLAGNLYGVSDARIFTALVYGLARKGYLTIETSSTLFFFTSYYLHKKNSVVNEEIDQQLIRRIFGINTVFNMNTIDYWKFKAYKYIRTDPQFTPIYHFREKQTVYFLKILPETRRKLNDKGQQLYEEIRGFAYFLAHVEKPRLQQMIKEDPHYIDEVLPRAVLLSMETRFLEVVEEIVGKCYVPEWYLGELSSLSEMVSSVSKFTKPPDKSSNTTRRSG
ncbi:MAG: DUF2207 domain-containing protein [Candidatus Peribacteria bacterium]|jgi:hypothetical protein|nr:DUF2207 domain-containing protein [Candidatus Peribacteria bacterium]